MNRQFGFLLILFLVCCSCLQAIAKEPASEYKLPQELQTVFEDVESLSLPDTFPRIVRFSSFVIINGMVHLELEQKVPKIKILEKNMASGTESTIFSKKNTDTADAHIVGLEEDTFIIRVFWNIDGTEFVQEFISLAGNPILSECFIEETINSTSLESYSIANRRLSFSEDGKLISEFYALVKEKNSLLRTVYYDPSGKLARTELCWNTVDNTGDYLELKTDDEGTITFLKYKNSKATFTATSQKITDDLDTPESVKYQSPDPYAFEELLKEQYPQLIHGLNSSFSGEHATTNAENIDSVTDREQNSNKQENLNSMFISNTATMTDLFPATVTDLISVVNNSSDIMSMQMIATTTDLIPATMTDLEHFYSTTQSPATLTDLIPVTQTDIYPVSSLESFSEVKTGSESIRIVKSSAESAPISSVPRIWSLFSDDNPDVDTYIFITEDPILILNGGKLSINKKAVDINGNPFSINKKLYIELPVIELPVIN